jgi:hypothetical protein
VCWLWLKILIDILIVTPTGLFNLKYKTVSLKQSVQDTEKCVKQFVYFTSVLIVQYNLQRLNKGKSNAESICYWLNHLRGRGSFLTRITSKDTYVWKGRWKHKCCERIHRTLSRRSLLFGVVRTTHDMKSQAWAADITCLQSYTGHEITDSTWLM